MKKTEKTILSIINWLRDIFPETEFNLNKKRDEIVSLLFNDGFTALSLENSTQLYLEVKREYERQLKEKEDFLIKELNAVNKYNEQKNTLQDKAKAHVNNPIFDIPVKEFTIVDFNRKANEVM